VLEADIGSVHFMAFSPEEAHVVCRSDHETVCMWDAWKGEQLDAQGPQQLGLVCNLLKRRNIDHIPTSLCLRARVKHIRCCLSRTQSSAQMYAHTMPDVHLSNLVGGQITARVHAPTEVLV
jgi:hypothetical protein